MLSFFTLGSQIKYIFWGGVSLFLFFIFWFHYRVLGVQLFSHRPHSQSYSHTVGSYLQYFLFNCFSLSTMNMLQHFFGFVYLSAVSQRVSLAGLYVVFVQCPQTTKLSLNDSYYFIWRLNGFNLVIYLRTSV